MPLEPEGLMGQFVRLTLEGELTPGQMKRVTVDWMLIVLADVGGHYYAFSAACPHRRGPLHQGKLVGEEIECPWHYFRWNVRTGENIYPANIFPPDLAKEVPPPLTSYRVRIRGEEIEIEMPQA